MYENPPNKCKGKDLLKKSLNMKSKFPQAECSYMCEQMSECTCYSFSTEGDSEATCLVYKEPTHASAKNDPQMQDVNGKKFAIVEKGTFTLLEIPRSHPKPMLKVLCNIQQIPSIASSCQAFITEVTVQGSSLGALGSITLSAANQSHSFGVALGPKAEFLSGQNLTSNFLAQQLKVAGAPETVSISVVKSAAHINVGGSVLSAYRPHGSRGQEWQWLNMEFEGLGSFNKEIGGILGVDEYHANPDPACKHHPIQFLENAGLPFSSFASAMQ